MGRFSVFIRYVCRDVWYAPVREDGASRIGNRLKLNEFAGHKKKRKNCWTEKNNCGLMVAVEGRRPQDETTNQITK